MTNTNKQVEDDPIRTSPWYVESEVGLGDYAERLVAVSDVSIEACIIALIWMKDLVALLPVHKKTINYLFLCTYGYTMQAHIPPSSCSC